LSKPKLILDTNVCHILASGSSTYDVARIIKRIRQNFQLVVSAQTFIELLNGIGGGSSDVHFEQDRHKLGQMVGSGRLRFLQYPGAFALRTALGLACPVPRFGPEDFRKWFKVVLAARTRAELFEGRVKLPNSHKRWWVDPATLSRFQSYGLESHQKWLLKAITGNCTFPEPQEWASRIGSALGKTLTTEQSLLLGLSLEAAYEYQKQSFLVAARNRSYNATKHNGDWVDNQQLFYLSDPSVSLLTEEKSIKEKCKGTNQSHRVLLMRTFKDMIL
jgi:hypothetical protein